MKEFEHDEELKGLIEAEVDAQMTRSVPDAEVNTMFIDDKDEEDLPF